MRLSIVGLVLGVVYLALPVYCAARVLVRNSFGGIFSEEFGLFVVTLPGSPLAEKLFKRHKYCRLVAYLVFAGLNAVILYFVGFGLQALFRGVS